MASITPLFDLQINNQGTTSTKDDWYAITTVTSGQQLWLGYATFISEDKNLTFELRANKATKSTGTTADTDLISFQSVQSADSKDTDMYLSGNITQYCPQSTVSTGVEKLWLRVRSGTNTAALFDYIIRYTLYY